MTRAANASAALFLPPAAYTALVPAHKGEASNAQAGGRPECPPEERTGGVRAVSRGKPGRELHYRPLRRLLSFQPFHLEPFHLDDLKPSPHTRKTLSSLELCKFVSLENFKSEPCFSAARRGARLKKAILDRLRLAPEISTIPRFAPRMAFSLRECFALWFQASGNQKMIAKSQVKDQQSA